MLWLPVPPAGHGKPVFDSFEALCYAFDEAYKADCHAASGLTSQPTRVSFVRFDRKMARKMTASARMAIRLLPLVQAWPSPGTDCMSA
jgi:hypothetical protein